MGVWVRAPRSPPVSCLLSSAGSESAGLRSRRPHVRIVQEAPVHGCVAERSIAPGCKPGPRWHGGSNPSAPITRACSSVGRAPVSKTGGRGSIPCVPASQVLLGIAKRSKAAVCKSVGVMPSLVQIQLPSPFPGSSVGRSAWLLTRRSAVRSRVGEPATVPRVAQWQSTVLIRRGSVDRVHPRGPAIRLGVAQLEARMPWEHEVVRSIRTTETSSGALRCGRSSKAEPQVVDPLMSVRFRPVTPQRIDSNQSPRGGNGRRDGLRSRGRKACPFDPGRGDHQQQGECRARAQAGPALPVSRSRASAARASRPRARSSVERASSTVTSTCTRSSGATILAHAAPVAAFKRCCLSSGCF
jgi:hypothetical protein